MSDLTIRSASESDTGLVRQFILELAEYERLADTVTMTEEDLRESLFGQPPSAEVLLAFEGKEAVGFAVFFHNFSTFVGRPGLYLEDLYVRPAFRGKGYGKAFLQHLARLAVHRRCGRMEWAVLDWNQPAIRFYQSLGAVAQDQWTVYRLTEDQMTKLASES